MRLWKLATVLLLYISMLCFRTGLSMGQEFEADSIAIQRCDSSWDGALAGILPVGGIVALVHGFAAEETEGGLSDRDAFLLGGAIGALVGLMVDAGVCNPRRTVEREATGLQTQERGFWRAGSSLSWQPAAPVDEPGDPSSP
jgi:hypothetical protein